MDSGEWIECFDETHQCVYYYNTLTEVSQWEVPYEVQSEAPVTDITLYSDIFSVDKETDAVEEDEINLYIPEVPRENPIPSHGHEPLSLLYDLDVISRTSSGKAMPEHMLMHSPASASSSSKLPPRIPDPFYYSDMDDEDEEEQGQADGAAALPLPALWDSYSKPVVEERVSYPIKATREDATYSERASHGGYNQDYVHLAQLYKLQRPYMDPVADLTCVLCHDQPALDVLFPCEHRCICKACIAKENVMEDHKMTVEQLESGSAFCNCPLCGSVIKKILESKGGREKEEYWTWALEIAPSLPPGFMRNFNHSAGVITAVYVNGMTEQEALQKSQGGCSVS